jgi:hypothetical protein
MLRDAQHRLLGHFVDHPLGQAASFFGSLVPIFGVDTSVASADLIRQRERTAMREDQLPLMTRLTAISSRERTAALTANLSHPQRP